MSVEALPKRSDSVNPVAPVDRPLRFGLRSLFLAVAVCATLCGIWVMVVIPIHERDVDMACRNKMKQILFIFLCHQDQRGTLPPPHFVDNRGTPINSWRLFAESYVLTSGCTMPDLSKPWNHPSKRKNAWQHHGGAFVLPDSGRREDDQRTCILAVTGAGTAFPTTPLIPSVPTYGGSMSLHDITDGLEDTILIVEVADSDIHWMEPRDLDIETMSFRINDESKPCLSSSHPDGPLVGFADGEVFRVSRDIPPETLRALLTATGGEDLDREDLVRQGYLK